MPSITSQNLDFLRWKYGTHEALQKELHGILSWNELSDFALGKKQMPAYQARAIEEKLLLPKGWFDRENLSLVEVSNSEYELFGKIQGVSEFLCVRRDCLPTLLGKRISS
jgi:hypothetical protein